MPPTMRWTRPPGAVTWSQRGRCMPSWPTTATGCSRPSCSRTLPARVAGPRRCRARWAISALRRDIAGKVACGLRLDDEGFHPTVLVYWRHRIRGSSQPRRIFEAVRQVVEQTGVLAGRGRRVLDSTVLADAVATQDTVTQLVAAIRRVRRLVPAARAVELAAHDYHRPGQAAYAPGGTPAPHG